MAEERCDAGFYARRRWASDLLFLCLYSLGFWLFDERLLPYDDDDAG